MEQVAKITGETAEAPLSLSCPREQVPQPELSLSAKGHYLKSSREKDIRLPDHNGSKNRDRKEEEEM